MGLEINIVAGKDMGIQGTIINSLTGGGFTIIAGSDVLFKLYRGNPGTPDLDLNGTATAAGSVTSFNTATSGSLQGQYTIQLFGADTSGLNPGTYDMEIDLKDHNNADRLMFVARGVAHILGTTSGNVT